MDKEIWAVVCGAIRDELEFKLIVNELTMMRQENYISGIVISTWEDELIHFPVLKKNLLENDIKIIEQKPLENIVSIANTTSLNYFRQAYQFQAALDILPDNCFVLKARTDRALKHLRLIKPYLLKDSQLISKSKEAKLVSGEEVPIFHYPMTVINVRTNRLFNFSDFVFFGYIDDMRKIINFDISELFLGRDLVANTQWFIYPFLKEFPVIKDYFKLINFRPLISGMKDTIEKFDDRNRLDMFPHFFYRVYVTYLRIIKKYFRIVSMENTLDFNKQEQEAYHFTDLFIENKPLGVAYTAIGTALLSDSVIENFLNTNKIGIEKLDIPYKKILETPKCSYSVTQQELNELKLFRADNNWFTFKNWLRMNACKNKLEKQSSEYSKNILDYYFSELTESENINLLNDLKQADSVDRYLFNYWVKHDEIGSDAAIQMVFPLARTRNQEAILILTRISRMGKLSNSVDWTSLKYLVDVTYDVQRQRGAITIKTCLLKLNHILEEYDNNNFLTIYENSFFREILFRYLESNEFKAIFNNNLSKEQLSDYLYTLSSHYKDKGRSTRALRLFELATEIDFSAQAFERLQQYYHENKLKNNEQLIFRTLTLFV